MKNEGLQALEPFIGKWEYTMYNCWFLPSLDTKIKGFAQIDRQHDAFLVMNETDADKKPAGIWIIGYSDPKKKYEMFYYDQRGVARIFNTKFDGKRLIFWRKDKDMHQRIVLEITDKGLHSTAEASDDKGQTWRKDLEITYTQIV